VEHKLLLKATWARWVSLSDQWHRGREEAILAGRIFLSENFFPQNTIFAGGNLPF